jgi:tetratricopeptide (TPR) repeat protein
MSLHQFSRQELSEAVAHFKAGRPADAIAACRAISAADLVYPEALHLRGIISFRAGDVTGALELIGRAVELKPDYGEACKNLGHVLRKLDRPIDAIAAYRQATELDPFNAQTHNCLGIVLQERGHLDEAITAFRRATAHRPDFAEALNRLGSALREKGQLDAAIATFARLVELHPGTAELHNNLGVVLAEAGRLDDAIGPFQRAIGIDPRHAEAHAGLGAIYRQQHKLDAAMQAFRRAVEIDPTLAEVHMAIYAIAQALGDKPSAVAHQRQALQVKRVFSDYCATRHPARNVLILNAPGDWQANIPTDFLFDKTSNNLHTCYLFDGAPVLPIDAGLPPCDVIFNAIAEPDTVKASLQLADRFIGATGKPWLNDPKLVLKTTRDHVAESLSRIDRCVVPKVRRAGRADLLAPSLGRFLGDGEVAMPFLIRPTGAHAGDNLVKIDGSEEVAEYLAGVPAAEFYVTDFVDYKNADGYYRKYRFIYVDGTPYPFHLAVSKNWMVHYYNADMAESAWKRQEESRFLADHHSLFDASLQRALDDIAKAIGLDYFGIDCSITADNRLLVFEVDVGMIVHLMDPIDVYPYKHRYVPRILQAIEEMIASRIAAAA